ncbi:MAG: alpha-amylase family glycosyl hydrolase [Clostridia bacterium]|nr:alpha-amylase family glycosyl hydrolase [Clostridia bacterium]
MNLNKVIYQIFFRTFTPEGTIKGAEKMIPYLASLGVDILYITAFCEADADGDINHWSERQKASGIKNPRNPYRQADYFKIDEEYGTDEDYISFVKTAHGYNMEVMHDLVFMHCGPDAVFIGDHPDYVQRDENGNILYNDYHFPIINYESRGARDYLIDNMKYWVEKFDIDGYRCDVGDEVPLDFWDEAVSAVKKIKPEFTMLNEGIRPEYLEKVFDINYNFPWNYSVNDVIMGEKPATCIVEQDTDNRKRYGDYPFVVLRGIDNHDIANDAYDKRVDAVKPREAAEAGHLLNFLIDGVPFLYNGNEIADGTRHSIWGNRLHTPQFVINWSEGYTVKGRERTRFLKDLIAYRKQNPSLLNGKTEWIANSASESLLTFTRELDDKNIIVIINMSESNTSSEINVATGKDTKEAMCRRAVYKKETDKLKAEIGPWGFIVLEY